MTELDQVTAILRDRSGTLTHATLAGGRRIAIWNIVWGRDDGAGCDHITTNMSPPTGDPVDFFMTDTVVLLEDIASGILLFSSGGPR